MTRLITGALCCCVATFMTPPAVEAAEISFVPADMENRLFPGVAFVRITGEIQPDDGQRFEEIAQKITGDHPKVVIVTLSGPGGNLVAGLRIGTVIHDRGWQTSVDADSTCDSACGYIWIAGVTRSASKTSHIGFHAAYNAATQQETGVGNAVLGSYLTKMGLSYGAIAYLTTSGPAQMTYLSAEAAANYGIAIQGELPLEASIAPPQSARKVVGRPYVDGNGNYVIPADIVPYVGVSPETVMARPPNYQEGLAILRHMFESGGPVSTGPDGSVIISAQAVLSKIPHCDRICSYGSMDVFTRKVMDIIRQIESSVLPAQVPETAGPAVHVPALCSPERLRLAHSYQNGGVEFALRALELCPAEMCPYLGTRLMESGNPDWAMAAARLCPHM